MRSRNSIKALLKSALFGACLALPIPMYAAQQPSGNSNSSSSSLVTESSSTQSEGGRSFDTSYSVGRGAHDNSEHAIRIVDAFLERNRQQYQKDLDTYWLEASRNCDDIVDKMDLLFDGVGFPKAGPISIDIQRLQPPPEPPVDEHAPKEGDSYPTELSLRFDSRRVAVDTLTRHLTGLNTKAYPIVESRWISIDSQRITWKEWSDIANDYVERFGISDVTVDSGRRLIKPERFFAMGFESIEQGAKGDLRGLDFSDVGEYSFTVEASEGFDGFEPKQEGTPLKKRVIKPVKSNSATVSAVQVSRLGLYGVDIADDDYPAPDFDFTFPAGQEGFTSQRVSVTPGYVLDVPDGELFSSHQNLLIKVASGSDLFRANGNSIELINRKVGVRGFRVIAEVNGLLKKRSPIYRVTSNRLEYPQIIDATTGEPSKRIIEAGQPIRLEARITGSGDFGGFKVRFAEPKGVKGWPKQPIPLKKDDSGWVASVEFTVGTDALKGNWPSGLVEPKQYVGSRRFELKAELLSADGAHVDRFPTDIVPVDIIPPRVQRVELLVKPSWEENFFVTPTTVDLFTPNFKSGVGLDAKVVLHFTNGETFEVDQHGVPYIGFRFDGGGKISRRATPSGKIRLVPESGSFALESVGELTAVVPAGAWSAYSGGGLLAQDANEIVSEPVTVNLNRLVLISQPSSEDKNRTTHSISVFGYAHMSGYSAQFLYQGETDSVDFVGDAEIPTVRSTPYGSEDLVDPDLLYAILYAPNGEEIADLSLGSNRTFGISPEFRVFVPETTPVDSNIVVSAAILNLPAEYWDISRVRWSIDPLYGYFVKEEVPLDMMNVGGGNGRAAGLIRIANDEEIIGLEALIRAELFFVAP